MADWVQTHFADRLALAWRGQRCRRSARSDRRRRRRAASPPPRWPRSRRPSRRRAAARAKRLYAVALEPRYRFENFVVGKANEVAFNAARTLATAENVAFNPLFLHGGTGRGKTHLLHAIGHEFHRLRPRATIIYMSAEKFMVEFVARCAPTRRSSSSSSCAPPTC
jgi:chromosomal replication initiator protein